MSEEIDLFENYEDLPSNVLAVIGVFEESDMTYVDCEVLINQLELIGYTCDYGLDSCPYGLKKHNMELVLTDIELNEDIVPNSNITYNVYFDGKNKFKAVLNDPANVRGCVSFEDAPRQVLYTLDKPIDEFTDEEKQNILDYRGLNLEEDGFEFGDIFMEKSYVTIVE